MSFFWFFAGILAVTVALRAIKRSPEANPPHEAHAEHGAHGGHEAPEAHGTQGHCAETCTCACGCTAEASPEQPGA